MNVNVLSTHENKLLDRKEVEAEIAFDGATPKRADLKQAISGKIAANPDFMVLRKVASSFGKKSVKITAFVYHSKESLMSIEPVHVKVREGFMQKPEKKKKEAAPKKKKV